MNYLLLTCLVALIIFGTPICLDPNQPDGSCTACGSLDILLEGSCYPKMRGCLTYGTPMPKCTQCQFGYVLVPEGKCVRQAVIQGTNSTTIPPVTLDNSTLSADQIKNAMGDQYPYYTDVHEQFISNYSELGRGAVKSVKKLATKKGTYFIIIYGSSSATSTTKYEAVALMDSNSKIIPLYMKVAQAEGKDPLTADTKIREIQGTKLTNFFIYDINFTSPNYKINYMNSSLNVIQFSFNMNDIGASLSTKLTIKNLTAQDLAKDQLFRVYPDMALKTLLSRGKIYDFYTFKFDSNISVSVRFTNFVFTVNKPIKISGDIPQFDDFGFFFDPFGFFNFFILSDPNTQGCLNLAIRQVPELQNALVNDVVSRQQANGDKYFHFYMQVFFFGDYYDVYSACTSSGALKTLLVLKNSNITLYAQKYNYNIDSLFFKSYVNATITSKVVVIPPIQSVKMKIIGSGTTYYKTFYSPNEFIQFTYNKSSGVTNLISYTVDGENILGILGVVGSTTQKTQPDLYMTYVQKKAYASPASEIASFIFNPLSSLLKYVSHQGTFETRVGNKSTAYRIENNTQVSSKNCIDTDGSNNKKVQNALDYLKSAYSLRDYTPQIIQMMVRSVGNIYRIVFSNLKEKQIQFIVQEIFTLPNVIKVTNYNDGYEFVEPINLNTDYQKMLSYLSKTTLAGSKVPILTESTMNKIRGYYNDGASTLQIILNKLTGAAKTNTYETNNGVIGANCLTSASGKCLTCATTHQLYQDSCWIKIQGCKVQAGRSCLRCLNPYILKDKTCKKQCSELLQPFSIY